MIDKELWRERLSEFPIVGTTVTDLLLNTFKNDEVWILRGIETLTDKPALHLGELWHRLTRETRFPISTGELCNALRDASQVIYLYMWLKSDSSVAVVIEDGCYFPEER